MSTKPPRLRAGDCVGIVSPSWGGAAIYPHRTERGIAQLRSLGFVVKLGRHALCQNGFVSDSPENRAADIHEMYLDPDVRVVLTAIGGDHSCHLLPYLDFELIRDHPKIFVGFSDTTVLSVAIWQETGIVTFYGPALLTEFAEYPAMLEFTRRAFLDLLSARTNPSFDAANEWTDELLDWGEKRDLERPRQFSLATGWRWFNRGTRQGVLVGGCLESLQHLRGTRFWPQWREAIFFFETSDIKPDAVDGILMDYENMGVFAELNGLLVGRSYGYSEAEHALLHEIVRSRTSKFDFPVVMDMDFGHTTPQLTLPIGCVAEIDTDRRRVRLLESAVA